MIISVIVNLTQGNSDRYQSTMKQGPSLKDIAKVAGVSINTVSRALNGKTLAKWPKIAERTERIRKIARELGYRPHSAARAMRTQRSNHLAIIVSGAYQAPFEYPVVMAINKTLQQHGYSLSIISAAEIDLEHPEKTLAFRENFLAGLFLMHVPKPVRELVLDISPNIIHVDSNIREASNCIYRDEYAAGVIAARHAIDQRCGKILFLGHVPWSDDCHCHVELRRRGVQETAMAADVLCEIREIGFQQEEYLQLGHELPKLLSPRTMVITAGENLAFFVATAATKAGLIPGKHFGLISCADTPQIQTIWPWLSRVHFPRFQLGRLATEMMLQLLAGKKQIPSQTLENPWIPGETAILPSTGQ